MQHLVESYKSNKITGQIGCEIFLVKKKQNNGKYQAFTYMQIKEEYRCQSR